MHTGVMRRPVSAQRETLENLHYTEPILRALHEKYDINYQRFTTRGGTTFRTHRGNYASSLDNTPGALVPRLTDEEQIKLQARRTLWVTGGFLASAAGHCGQRPPVPARRRSSAAQI